MSAVEQANMDVKRVVKQHWGNRAAEFDAKPNHGLHSDTQHRAWLDVLYQLTGALTLQALDIGCGTGFLTLLLAELGHNVTGVDIAPEMLELARQKATQAGLAVEFRLGDAEKLEDTDDSYDLIVARHLIWTLPNPAQAVREWQRLLKPGGRLALVEGNWGTPTAISEYEEIRSRLPFYGGLPSEQLTQFLQAQGLRNIVVQPLMDATLWGEEPQRPRYLVIAEA
ncbi:class I SAM-dependent methyltransferase [Nitrolancea hollandica]|uniref:Methyltransferase type 11 n=1 Tax=Nitrolancea hollandica Lb TaxID=1129897 RepID=I4EEL6_9BACT|nr:class I SAM-dependent methyltransferase [Nitrolancea hollandica]CCF83128.1 Methyltransferase type 11 [Nitrolancea hollandica Lb]